MEMTLNLQPAFELNQSTEAVNLMTFAVSQKAADHDSLREDDPRAIAFDELLARYFTTRVALLRVWHLAGTGNSDFRNADDEYDVAAEALLLAQPPTWGHFIKKLSLVLSGYERDSWTRECIGVDAANLLNGTAA